MKRKAATKWSPTQLTAHSDGRKCIVTMKCEPLLVAIANARGVR